jgi:hypothetical protein
MHAIWLIFFLVLIFCGPGAVIRSALGCVTLLALAVGAIVVMYWLCHLNQPETERTAVVYQTVAPAPTPNDYAPRAIGALEAHLTSHAPQRHPP